MRDVAIVADQFVKKAQLLPAVLHDEKNGAARMIPHHIKNNPRLFKGERCADISALRHAENGDRFPFESRFAVKQRAVEIDLVGLSEQVREKPFEILAWLFVHGRRTAIAPARFSNWSGSRSGTRAGSLTPRRAQISRASRQS